MQDADVHRPITVDNAVVQPSRIPPRDCREPGLRRVRDERRRLAEHGEVPQECVTAQPVAVDLGGSAPRNEALGLLDRIDHLAPQEEITLHRRVWPPPGLRP